MRRDERRFFTRTNEHDLPCPARRGGDSGGKLARRQTDSHIPAHRCADLLPQIAQIPFLELPQIKIGSGRLQRVTVVDFDVAGERPERRQQMIQRLLVAVWAGRQEHGLRTQRSRPTQGQSGVNAGLFRLC